MLIENIVLLKKVGCCLKWGELWVRSNRRIQPSNIITACPCFMVNACLLRPTPASGTACLLQPAVYQLGVRVGVGLHTVKHPGPQTLHPQPTTSSWHVRGGRPLASTCTTGEGLLLLPPRAVACDDEAGGVQSTRRRVTWTRRTRSERACRTTASTCCSCSLRECDQVQ